MILSIAYKFYQNAGIGLAGFITIFRWLFQSKNILL